MTRDIPQKPIRHGDEFNYHRQIRASLIRKRFGANPIDRFTQTQSAVLVAPAQRRSYGGTGEVEVVRYRVKAIFNEYLRCRTWDGATEGDDDVFVAKDPNLRTTIGSSVTTRTINVTPDGGGLAVAATEDITPPYAVNSEIFAVEPDGGTGVVITGSPPTDITWLDLNVAARYWALPLRVVEVCVGNVTRRMVVRGGAPA